MKKLISARRVFVFALVLALVAAFASCNLNPKPGGNDASRNNDDDGGSSPRELPRYVTLRLADYGEYENDTIGITYSPTANTRRDSRSESRALTHDNAVASHDFFEAVFYFQGNGTVARAAWDIGVTPELRGVYRTAGGINYNSVTPGGQGSAVLFVGSKADKTLLAIGRLTEVDGVQGTTTINLNTKSVTFEVTAIKAGVAPDQASLANTSFRTYRSYNVSTNVPGIESTTILPGIYLNHLNRKEFPLFKLGRTGETPNQENYGAYTFFVNAPGYYSTNFDAYAAGIVLAGERHYEARNPRYPITNGLYHYSSELVQDLNMTHGGQLDMMNNNQRLVDGYNPLLEDGTSNARKPFINPVVFKIDTSPSQDGSVFALTFEIFVYNLTARPTTLDNSDPVKWRISTGAGTTWLDLDDGSGGNGGAVFLGSGNVAAYLNQYPYTPPPGP